MIGFLLGAAAGATAVYFFDPTSGENRRRQVMSLWDENRGQVLQKSRGATDQLKGVSEQLAGVAAKAGDMVAQKTSDTRPEGDGSRPA